MQRSLPIIVYESFFLILPCFNQFSNMGGQVQSLLPSFPHYVVCGWLSTLKLGDRIEALLLAID